MYTLYSLQVLMLLSALSMLALPLIITHDGNRFIIARNFLILSLLIAVCTFTLYRLSGNHTALQQWLEHGKQHYQLQIQLDQLGGVDGIIERIKKKLAANPQDAQGWLILGKLYLAKHDQAKAKAVLTKAHELQPENQEINKILESM